jgi:hypothetical protein
MEDPFKQDEPPKALGKPLKPSKPPLFKDRRAHRIELRNKISTIKEEIKELKSTKEEDESKQIESQKKMSILITRLKESEMEKESIEQFNHTQFVKNVEKSREAESRYDKESQGTNNFFEDSVMNSQTEHSVTDLLRDDHDKTNSIVDLQREKEQEISPSELEVQPTSSLVEEEVPEDILPQIEIPPNTIV